MDKRIERLRAIHRLETGAEMDEFDELVAALANEEPLDPKLLPDLFLSFYDDTENEEMMWGLLHLVEDFPSTAYASALIEVLPEMVAQAKEWAVSLLQRTLNSETDRGILREAYLAATPANQKFLRDFLKGIVENHKAFADKVEEITAS